jgi:hypothetical protein
MLRYRRDFMDADEGVSALDLHRSPYLLLI